MKPDLQTVIVYSVVLILAASNFACELPHLF